MRRTDIARALAFASHDTAREYILKGPTYGEIYGLASRISTECSRYGLRRNPLCLATPDKALLMAGILSSLAGGSPLVLPASLSEAVVAEACRMSGAAAVLCDRPIAAPKGVRSLILRKNGTQGRARVLRRNIDEPFLWLYTGGSTGAPKLWPKTAANLVGEAVFLGSLFRLRRADIVLATVPPLHIYGLLFSVLLPFVSGARVIGDVPYFPREIIRKIGRTACTVFVGSPMHYRALSASSFPTTRLRHAFSSGGFLEEPHSLHFTKATGIGVTEVYGSTETGGIAVRCRAAGESAWRPFSCVRWAMAGERLSVSSPFLSPSLSTDRKGYYTTGDRAADAGDGTFVLYGRADGIVKIAGKRVDLAAIEQRIKSLPSIRDAWVLSLPTGSGRENEIAALLVTKAGIPRLRKTFARALEPTHVPRRIARVPSLPVTPAGKRDHQAALALLTATTSP